MLTIADNISENQRPELSIIITLFAIFFQISYWSFVCVNICALCLTQQDNMIIKMIIKRSNVEITKKSNDRYSIFAYYVSWKCCTQPVLIQIKLVSCSSSPRSPYWILISRYRSRHGPTIYVRGQCRAVRNDMCRAKVNRIFLTKPKSARDVLGRAIFWLY